MNKFQLSFKGIHIEFRDVIFDKVVKVATEQGWKFTNHLKSMVIKYDDACLVFGYEIDDPTKVGWNSKPFEPSVYKVFTPVTDFYVWSAVKPSKKFTTHQISDDLTADVMDNGDVKIGEHTISYGTLKALTSLATEASNRR